MILGLYGSLPFLKLLICLLPPERSIPGLCSRICLSTEPGELSLGRTTHLSQITRVEDLEVISKLEGRPPGPTLAEEPQTEELLMSNFNV